MPSKLAIKAYKIVGRYRRENMQGRFPPSSLALSGFREP